MISQWNLTDWLPCVILGTPHGVNNLFKDNKVCLSRLLGSLVRTISEFWYSGRIFRMTHARTWINFSERYAVKCHQLFSHLVTVEGSWVRGDAFNPSHHNFASEENFSHYWSRVWCQQVQVINIFIKPIKLVSKTEIFCWHLHFQLKNNFNINWLIKLVFSLLINCLPLLIITA